MKNDMPIIEVKDLRFSYNGASILDEVQFTVRAGDFVAVVGPNGGGKTTLLKLLLGLLKPDRGQIRVFGLPPEKAAPKVGYVPQDTGVNRSVPVSVLDVVLMGRLRGGGGWSRFSKKDRALAEEALKRVGMLDLRQRRMGELSGGQRQRVLVARALVSAPGVLFLDEPTSNVDTKGQITFFEFLKELNETVTILLASHDTAALSIHAKSVAWVSRNVNFQDRPEVTREMLGDVCHYPVELMAHGSSQTLPFVHRDS